MEACHILEEINIEYVAWCAFRFKSNLYKYHIITDLKDFKNIKQLCCQSGDGNLQHDKVCFKHKNN